MPSVPDMFRTMVKEADDDSPLSWGNPVNQLVSGVSIMTPAGPYLFGADILHRIFVDYPRRKRRGQEDAALASIASGLGQAATFAIPGGKAATTIGKIGGPATKLTAWLGLPAMEGIVGSKYDVDRRGEIPQEVTRDAVKAYAGRSVVPYVAGAGALAIGTAALVDYIRRRRARKMLSQAGG